MLLLAMAALIRGPVYAYPSVGWFFVSWLPGELPWLFALIQVAGTFFFVFMSNDVGMFEVCLFFISAITLVIWLNLHLKTFRSELVLRTALVDSLGGDFYEALPPDIGVASPSVIQNRDWLKPFGYRRPGVERIKDIIYGDAERNKLDIYRGTKISSPPLGRPVVLHIHGGAWMIGNKYQQAQPLIKYLAQNGWICLDINYRLATTDRYPACIIDVKKAIVWVKENIERYGGDSSFIVITGGSAGGHLSALAALTPNSAEFQPGFEMKDTQVQAVIPIYGIYDLEARPGDGPLMHQLLERYVMPCEFKSGPDRWRNASPINRAGNLDLPIFVVHGVNDCVVPVKQAQEFVKAVKHKNSAPVVYAELLGAQHGFDIFHSVRTEFYIEAVGKFLHYCYANYCSDRKK